MVLSNFDIIDSECHCIEIIYRIWIPYAPKSVVNCKLVVNRFSQKKSLKKLIKY